MEFKINGKEIKLNFGVRFVAEMDKTQIIDGGNGVTFGIGTALAEEKLRMGNFETLALVIKNSAHQHSLTLDEVYDAIDEYEDLNELFEKVEEELKNSKAVQASKARMEKQAQEANRKQAQKRTKK